MDYPDEYDFEEFEEKFSNIVPNFRREFNNHVSKRSEEFNNAYDSYGSQEFYRNYQDDFVSAAESLGYDGVAFTDPSSSGTPVSFVAFQPEQIKSAIGNRGSFDPRNPDIRYSVQTRESAPADFPDTLESVISSTSVSYLKGRTSEQKEQYQRAKKGGDAIAATKVVKRVLKKGVVENLKSILGDREGVIVPVLQPEGTSYANMLPVSFAEVLENVLPDRKSVV